MTIERELSFENRQRAVMREGQIEQREAEIQALAKVFRQLILAGKVMYEPDLCELGKQIWAYASGKDDPIKTGLFVERIVSEMVESAALEMARKEVAGR